MNKKELNDFIKSLYRYNKPIIKGRYGKMGCKTTQYSYKKKVIDVTEDDKRIRCVIVWNDTLNASRRDAKQVYSIEELKERLGL